MSKYTCPICGGDLTFTEKYCGCKSCQINQGYGNSEALAYIDFMSKIPLQVLIKNLSLEFSNAINAVKEVESSVKSSGENIVDHVSRTHAATLKEIERLQNMMNNLS